MITSLYAGLLALLYFKISIDTIRARRKNKISVGYGPNNEIAQIVSAHANFSSFAFFLLLLLFLVERSGLINQYAIHALGATFTVGRCLHYVAFKARMNFKLRVLGMMLTLFPMTILGFMNLYCFFKA